ncbi:MAG: hypothetical protein GY714_09030 [Desulfobacterales bacterium]|nr:hypothetical protein [Desulfobacterales bacterium]
MYSLEKSDILPLFYKSVEKNVNEFYGSNQCIIYNSNEIGIVFEIDKNISIDEANFLESKVEHLPSDFFIEYVNLEILPEFLKKNIVEDFKYYCAYYKNVELYNIFKKKLKTVVKGTIVDKNNDTYIVDIDNHKCIFPKINQVKSELNLYKEGNTLDFFVLKVFGKPFEVELSRSSKKLPGILLKEKYPLNIFSVRRRVCGEFSLIKTDIQFNNSEFNEKFSNFRKVISEKLNGEKIITKNTIR